MSIVLFVLDEKHKTNHIQVLNINTIFLDAILIKKKPNETLFWEKHQEYHNLAINKYYPWYRKTIRIHIRK